MKKLLIDTATERSLLALSETGKELKEHHLPTGLLSSKHLIPDLEQLQQGDPVDAIVVGVGPGSYTGIRVGVAVARGLAYAWQVPVQGVCSLQGFIPTDDGPFAAVVDARVGGLYVHQGSRQKGHVEWEGQPMLLPKDAWEKHLTGRTIVTPNASILKKRLPDASIKEVALSGKELLWVAEQSPLPCEILYLRKTQAELEI